DIPTSRGGLGGTAAFDTILDHNSAYIRSPKSSGRAKLQFLAAYPPKGDYRDQVSCLGGRPSLLLQEMGGQNLPDVLTPRDMSNLYKRSLFNWEMLKFTDHTFAEFIEMTGFGRCFYNYERHDMFYWEHRMSAWASLANQDHD